MKNKVDYSEEHKTRWTLLSDYGGRTAMDQVASCLKAWGAKDVWWPVEREVTRDSTRRGIARFDDGLWYVVAFGGIAGGPTGSADHRDGYVAPDGKEAWRAHLLRSAADRIGYLRRELKEAEGRLDWIKSLENLPDSM